MNKKQFIIILVATFIAIMTWVVSDIIFNTKPAVPVKPEMESLLEPINPSFNSEVLDQVSQISTRPTLDSTPTQPTPSQIPLPSLLLPTQPISTSSSLQNP